MNILDGIKNFLTLVNDNWTTICVIAGLIVALVKKASSLMECSTDEKVETAKAQIQEIMLRLVTEAELDYSEWTKAGEIKRAQVIEQIYEKFPILDKVVDQESLVAWIDGLIDEALVVLRQVIETNANSCDEEEATEG